MHLSIKISAGLLITLSLNAPVMSQPPIQIVHTSLEIANSTNSDSARLRANYQLWSRQKIYNYRYTYSNSCFCIPEARGPVIIEVRDGKTYSITNKETGQPVSNPEYFQNYNTILKLFKVIRNAIAQKAYRVDVKYNNRLGYPTQITIDYNKDTVDEELYISVENLEIIK